MTNENALYFFLKAVQGGDINAVEQFLDAGKSEESKVTALRVAAWHGHSEIVKLLLGRGADVNAKDNYGRTALMVAGQHGHEDNLTTNLLKNAGARE